MYPRFAPILLIGGQMETGLTIMSSIIDMALEYGCNP